MLFILFIVFTYWTKWRSLTIVNYFGKTASLCLQGLYSFQMCKSGKLSNGGMKSQSDEEGKNQERFVEWFCGGRRDKRMLFYCQSCQCMQAKVNFVFDIDRNMAVMNHRTWIIKAKGFRKKIKENKIKKWIDMCGFLASSLLCFGCLQWFH